MSILFKCDVCGKNEEHTKTKISHEPLKLKIKNFKGKKFNAYLYVILEDEADAKKIDELRCMKEEKVIETITDNDMILDTPNPSVCEKCKKEILKDLSKFGKTDKTVKGNRFYSDMTREEFKVFCNQVADETKSYERIIDEDDDEEEQM